ncbi:hypothetical protein BJ508DRAFT_375735 [Ascobolus immersus RN42]|uniref:Uncharacterized protein n=1 Tax=Ascobolus immersus RN42 TaxID=1160509 RepID=A0A3N4IAJ1_ASCIM|nr:hypothetical protein BJ508DRAFT_375735 [Ascobolus immersus RN42]
MAEKRPANDSQATNTPKRTRQSDITISSSAPEPHQSNAPPTNSASQTAREGSTASSTTTRDAPQEATKGVDMISSASVPLSIFTNALPASSETLKLLNSLPTSPNDESAESLHPSLQKYQHSLHIDRASCCLILTGCFPPATPHYLLSYLALLAPLRSLGNRQRSANDSSEPMLPAQYQNLFLDLSESAGCGQSEKALVLAYLAVLARKLRLEELQDLAENSLNKLLTDAASLRHGWADFDPTRSDYWEGAVRWDEKVDVGVDGMVGLIRAVLANPYKDELEANTFQHADRDYDEKSLREMGHAKRYTGYEAVPWNNDWPHGEISIKRQFQKNYLTELVYKFFASRVTYLRYHPEVISLMTELPQLTLDILVRYPPQPSPVFYYKDGFDYAKDRNTLSSDWVEEKTYAIREFGKALEKVELCVGCRGTIESLGNSPECICGKDLEDAEECDNCRRYRHPDGNESDDEGDGDKELEGDDMSDDEEMDTEELQKEMADELDDLLRDFGSVEGWKKSLGWFYSGNNLYENLIARVEALNSIPEQEPMEIEGGDGIGAAVVSTTERDSRERPGCFATWLRNTPEVDEDSSHSSTPAPSPQPTAAFIPETPPSKLLHRLNSMYSIASEKLSGLLSSAFHPGSKARDAIDALGTFRPPAPVQQHQHYHLAIHRGFDPIGNESIFLTSDDVVSPIVLQKLEGYTTLLASVKVLPKCNKMEANPILSGRYRRYPSIYFDASHLPDHLTPGEKAIILLHMAIMARKLGIDELQDLAEEALNTHLSAVCTRLPAWAHWNPNEGMYWDGAVKWDEELDIGFECTMRLIKTVLANPEEPPVEKEEPETDDSDDEYMWEGPPGKRGRRRHIHATPPPERLCNDCWHPGQSCHGFCLQDVHIRSKNLDGRRRHVYTGRLIRPHYYTSDWPDTAYNRLIHIHHDPKGYLTELIYKFVSTRFAYLRYYPEMQELLKENPGLMYDLLMRYPPMPTPVSHPPHDFEELAGPALELLDATTCGHCGKKGEWNLDQLRGKECVCCQDWKGSEADEGETKSNDMDDVDMGGVCSNGCAETYDSDEDSSSDHSESSSDEEMDTEALRKEALADMKDLPKSQIVPDYEAMSKEWLASCIAAQVQMDQPNMRK